VLFPALRVGYPVLVKATDGGGGKGIRLVRNEHELASALERTRSEAKSAFGSDAVYIEKVTGSGDGKIVEISVKVQPEMQGSPVMNAQGRVIGVAVLPDPAGRGQVVGLSPDWAVRKKPVEAAPTPAPAEPAPAAPAEGGMKTREQIQAERREAVEKAVTDSMK